MGALHPSRLTASNHDDTDAHSGLVGRSMPRIVIGDGALYYERQGVGFPVLFISGLSGFASFWQDQVAAFARKFDVVTHDHPGIGQSDVTRSGFTVDRRAADVVGPMGLDAILAFDRTERLGRIKTPTLVVGAEDDIVTPAYFSEELARLIPGAEIKIFPRGGHALTQVRAREFNQAVLPFLASHTPT